MRYALTVMTTAMLSVGANAVAAQQYRPSYANPSGKEVVAAYLSARSCLACRAPEMPALLDSMKVQLERQAAAHGEHFRAVFVGMDWEPDSALVMARMDGPWDELDIGRNWFNAGAQLYVWSDTLANPVMPGVMVFEQSVTLADRARFGPLRLLRRVAGSAKLAKWVAQGSPIDAWRQE